MKAVRHPAILFILFYTTIFYLWIILFKESTLLLNKGVIILLITGGAVSFYWLFNSFLIIKSKQRYFWLWMSLGVLFYSIANMIWFLDRSAIDLISFVGTADYIWLVSYVFFTIAFVYQIKRLIVDISIIPVIFNIVIFITVVTSINIYYIVQPVLNHAIISDEMSNMTLAYSIYNLGFLIAVISIYFLSYGTERGFISFIIFALIIQSITDSIYSYLSIIGKYDTGSLVDPLWQIVILVFGLSSIYDRKKRKSKLPSRTIAGFQRVQMSPVPYIGVLALLGLVIIHHTESINALTIGLSISLVLILTRQIIVVRSNAKLVREYKQIAYHDTLTGLSNRWKFKEDVELLVETAKEEDQAVTLMLLDINRFKYVNDTLGHNYGDLLLIEFATRLEKLLDDRGRLYRIGGDEFMISFFNLNQSEIKAIVEEIVEEKNQLFIIENHEISVTPSIGISIFPENATTVNELVNKVDAAMYFSKEKDTSFHFYDEELNNLIARKRILESSLKNARENNELELFYQPQFELQTGKLIGMEALIRWNHPELGLVSPAEFIPLAEQTGHIVSFGEWVLETACRQNKKWQDAGYENLCVSVNVSARQFRHNNFFHTVTTILDRTGLDPTLLELEITESIMQDVDESVKVMTQLRELGLSVSIDDFGTGYSSLYMLRQLPIDTLKVDKSFIDNIVELTNQSIVKTIIDIGHNLQLKVIAEGIESIDQVSVLKQQGCILGQGYIFSKPLPVKEFDVLLADEKNYLIPMI
ncbi:putative bifunctional diguanylate cyclase/phosphodiesterase [Virgibacillus sp. DJP39]|uniref:putative bifunctional diguanylate cyclase/phosphodiesterase n=1 Tax=Virgibacillus sp. DJP39 TaxID=3409790 RepID=UPI003BB548D3